MASAKENVDSVEEELNDIKLENFLFGIDGESVLDPASNKFLNTEVFQEFLDAANQCGAIYKEFIDTKGFRALSINSRVDKAKIFEAQTKVMKGSYSRITHECAELLKKHNDYSNHYRIQSINAGASEIDHISDLALRQKTQFDQRAIASSAQPVFALAAQPGYAPAAQPGYAPAAQHTFAPAAGPKPKSHGSNMDSFMYRMSKSTSGQQAKSASAPNV